MEADQQPVVHDFQRTVVRIGHHSENELALKDRSVSAHHGEIRLSADGLIYRDLRSTNGSIVRRAEQLIRVNSEHDFRIRLEEGDEIVIGTASRPKVLRVRWVEDAARSTSSAENAERRVDISEAVEATAPQILTGLSRNFDREALLALYEFTTSSARQKDLDELLDHFGTTIIALFQRANRLSIYVQKPSGEDYVPVLVRDRKRPRKPERMSHTLREMVLDRGRAVLFNAADPELRDADSLHDCEIRSGLCAPLWNGKQVIGLVQMDARGGVPLPFGPRDLEVFTVFSHQLALAAENKRLTQGLRESVRSLKRTQTRMEQLAFYDPLTGLYNRRLFRDRLEHAIRQMNRSGQRLAVLYLDLDNFKHVNDTLGHDAGDILLRVLSERLRGCVRDQDTVARIGGDEIGILLIEVSSVEGAMLVAEKIVSELREPVEVGSQSLVVTTSVGITVAPDDGSNAETLLKNADLALYRAKDRGRNNFQFFIEDMNQETSNRLFLEGELRQGIARAEFTHRFQPIISLADGNMVGAEVLVRWNHPTRGLLRPGAFVDFAEECGLIVELGKWGILTACRQLAALQQAGHRDFRLSVNLSGRQFREADLVDNIEHSIEQSGARARGLQVEITETMLIEDIRTSWATLERLRGLGVSVAIDDFGTGYSSLAYLNELPIDTLKIDRSFVQRVPDQSGRANIAAAVIAIAHKLNKTVIAEGIEHPQQLAVLQDLGCDFGQGYLFGRPVPIADLREQLERPEVLNRESEAAPHHQP